MFCDLHSHSVHSDGTFTPKEIAAEAKRLRLTAVALTDHNTVSGQPEFLKEAARLGVTAVPGVELSTVWEGSDLHLLGLFIAPEHYKEIAELMKGFYLRKEESNRALVERLNEAGYRIDYADVKKRNLRGNVNRAHIAAELRDRGYVSSIAEAFDTLLEESHGFYTPPERLQTIDAIAFLKKIKAVPVLAHPLLDIDEAALRRLLPEAIGAGLLGIETRHASYTKEQAEIARSAAEDLSLLQSGGSDFHGDNKPDIRLGTGKGDLQIPNEFYEKLLNASEMQI